MGTPEIAQKAPYAVDMKPGQYYWCACGKSAGQPFCDGSHKGGEFTPIAVTIDEEKTVYWCGCKNSANKPFCDGSHKSL